MYATLYGQGVRREIQLPEILLCVKGSGYRGRVSRRDFVRLKRDYRLPIAIPTAGNRDWNRRNE